MTESDSTQPTLSLANLRHSAAELMASAVADLYPGVFLVDSVVNEFGFYYDFIAEQPIDEHGLILIEEKMRGLAKAAIEVRAIEMMRENAAAFFQHKNQPFLAQRVLDAEENIVAIFQMGEFNDYCPFPHITNSSESGAFKVLRVERATYFIADEGEISVVRIHGTACFDSYALKKHVKALNAAKKKDHEALGEKLGLFFRSDDANPYGWIWMDNGVKIRGVLLELLGDAHIKVGFHPVLSPPLISDDLARKYGAYDQLVEEEIPPVSTYEDRDFVLPTHFGPVHAEIFASKKRTHSDLPLRLFECGYVSNFKKETHLWGLLNSRFVYADEGRIFCGNEQVIDEIISSLQFIEKIIKIFNFEGHWILKGQGTKFAGTPSRWNKAIESIEKAFEACGYSYSSDGADTSYAGPVVEMILTDSLGREWKGPSLSFDFCGVDRMNLRYKDSEGEMVKPVMLVRTIYGSIERIVAILLEHDAGVLTTLLATAKDER